MMTRRRLLVYVFLMNAAYLIVGAMLAGESHLSHLIFRSYDGTTIRSVVSCAAAFIGASLTARLSYVSYIFRNYKETPYRPQQNI